GAERGLQHRQRDVDGAAVDEGHRRAEDRCKKDPTAASGGNVRPIFVCYHRVIQWFHSNDSSLASLFSSHLRPRPTSAPPSRHPTSSSSRWCARRRGSAPTC